MFNPIPDPSNEPIIRDYPVGSVLFEINCAMKRASNEPAGLKLTSKQKHIVCLLKFNYPDIFVGLSN